MNDNIKHEEFGTLIKKLGALVDRAAESSHRFLSVTAAAERSSLSVESIRRLLNSGRLTALRPVRGKILIDVRELDSMIASSKSSPRTGRGQGGNQ